MGFPFYYTRSNDSRLRKIKENLRKSNKKRIDLVEIMSLNVVEEAVLQSGVHWRSSGCLVYHAAKSEVR